MLRKIVSRLTIAILALMLVPLAPIPEVASAQTPSAADDAAGPVGAAGDDLESDGLDLDALYGDGGEGEGITQVLRRQHFDDGAGRLTSPVEDLRDLNADRPVGTGAFRSAADLGKVLSFDVVSSQVRGRQTVVTLQVLDGEGQGVHRAEVRHGRTVRSTRTDGTVTFLVATRRCTTFRAYAPAGRSFDNGAAAQKREVCPGGDPSVAGSPEGLKVTAENPLAGTLSTQNASGGTLSMTLSSHPGAIQGWIDDEFGQGVPGVYVDLFEAQSQWVRGAFLTSTSPDTDGRFAFTDLPVDCFILVGVAPDGYVFANGTKWSELYQCVDTPAGSQNSMHMSTRLLGIDFDGRITDPAGIGVDAIAVDVFEAVDPWTRGNYLDSTVTDLNGWFVFRDLPAGCYILVGIAPVGSSFDTGSRWHEVHGCTHVVRGRDDSGQLLFELGMGYEGLDEGRLNGVSVADLDTIQIVNGQDIVADDNFGDELRLLPTEDDPLAPSGGSFNVEFARSGDVIQGVCQCFWNTDPFETDPLFTGRMMLWEPAFATNSAGIIYESGHYIENYQHSIATNSEAGPRTYTTTKLTGFGRQHTIMPDGSWRLYDPAPGDIPGDPKWSRLKYTVTDAAGRQVPTSIQLNSSSVTIEIQDDGFLYPLTGSVAFTFKIGPAFLAPFPDLALALTNPAASQPFTGDELDGQAAAIALLRESPRTLERVERAARSNSGAQPVAAGNSPGGNGLSSRLRVCTGGPGCLAAVVAVALVAGSAYYLHTQQAELDDFTEAEIERSTDWILANSTEPELSPSQAATLAALCVQMVLDGYGIAADSGGYGLCSSVPIYVPSYGDIFAAADFRADAISSHPAWVVQRRVFGRTRTSPPWYDNTSWPQGRVIGGGPVVIGGAVMTPTAGCSTAAQPDLSDLPADAGALWNCDEFPNHVMVDGGPGQIVQPGLRWMPSTWNQREGAFLRWRLFDRCGIAHESEIFLVIPISSYVAPDFGGVSVLPPTLGICP